MPAPESERRIIEVRISPRSIIAASLIVLAVVAGVWAIGRAEGVLIWALIAALLASGIDPLVGRIERTLRLGRTAATSLVMTAMGLLGAGVGLILIPRLVEGVQALLEGAPGYWQAFTETAVGEKIAQTLGPVDQVGQSVASWLGGAVDASTAVSVAQQAALVVLGVLSIIVMTFCMLIYGRSARAFLITAAPAHLRARLGDVTSRIHQAVAGYLRGMIALALMSAVVNGALFFILDLPSALPLATWQGICVFIPVVGAILGAIPAVIVAFTVSPTVGVIVIVFIVVYQQVENHALYPVVMRQAMRLNPFLVLFALLVGTALLGLLGALVAVPVAGALQVLTADMWRRGVPRWSEADDADERDQLISGA